MGGGDSGAGRRGDRESAAERPGESRARRRRPGGPGVRGARRARRSAVREAGAARRPGAGIEAAVRPGDFRVCGAGGPEDAVFAALVEWAGRWAGRGREARRRRRREEIESSVVRPGNLRRAAETEGRGGAGIAGPLSRGRGITRARRRRRGGRRVRGARRVGPSAVREAEAATRPDAGIESAVQSGDFRRCRGGGPADAVFAVPAEQAAATVREAAGRLGAGIEAAVGWPGEFRSAERPLGRHRGAWSRSPAHRSGKSFAPGRDSPAWWRSGRSAGGRGLARKAGGGGGS